MKTKKTRNGGQWSEARFNSFIKSALRKASMRWGPVNQVKKAAWVERGKYLCEVCGQVVPLTKDKKKNVFVDHIDPIVPPEEGFTTWDKVIDRMFCEADNLQVLCGECHKKKSQQEREARK